MNIRRLRLFRVSGAVLLATFGVAAVTAFVPVSSVPTTMPPTAAPRAATDVTKVVRERFRLSDLPLGRIAPNVDNYAARTSSHGPLLLFLAATGHHPSQYTDFLAVARDTGYHVLALDYWNTGQSVERTCGTNPVCYTDMQRNRLDGSRPTRFSSVNRANSIVDRLHDSLTHLQSVDAAGNWKQFLSGENINWSNVVVAGHSQGGGEAAYISHLHAVRGVLMFSSPVDSDGQVDASWMASRGATPASRMYGFDDTGDVFGTRIVASWNALGMGAFGPAANVDSGLPAHSHELVSSLNLGDPKQGHLRDVTNDVPLVAGKPVFGSVWRWLLTRSLESNPIAATTQS